MEELIQTAVKKTRTVLVGEAPSLEDFLLRFVPAAPARVLAIGWPDNADLELFAPSGVELVLASAAANAPRSSVDPFDLILWRTAASAEEIGEVGALRSLLGEGASLVVACLLRKAYDELPPSGEAAFRALAQTISEARLAVIEDRNLTLPGAEGCWRIHVAKPDPMAIRSYQAGDEEEILRLFQPCFHVEQDLARWRWKYVENPWGQTVISVALAESGELTAHYAGYPTPFWIGDRKNHRTFLSIQLGDIMTNPAFRDLGRRRSSLLARTVRHFFAARRDGTYGFYYGFPIRLHQRFCEWFIGARKLEPAPLWVRDQSSDATACVASRGIRVERLLSPPPACDRLFRRAAPHYGFLMHRTARYLDWRYFQNPAADYVVLGAYRWLRLVGWAVFRRDGERLLWGDALFEPQHARSAAASILARAERIPELAGASSIEGWFSDRPAWWHQILPELGFERRDEPNQLAFIYFPDSEPDSPQTLSRLYYTLGDIDLF